MQNYPKQTQIFFANIIQYFLLNGFSSNNAKKMLIREVFFTGITKMEISAIFFFKLSREVWQPGLLE